MCHSRFSVPDDFDRRHNGAAAVVAKIEAGVALSRYYRPRQGRFPLLILSCLLLFATIATTIAILAVY